MALQQTIDAPGKDAGYGYFAETWLELDSLYAAYFFGPDWPMADNEAYDYALFKRDCSRSGVLTRPNDYSIVPGDGAFITTPFADSDLLASGTAHECTILAIAQEQAGITGTVASTWTDSTGPAIKMFTSGSGTLAVHNSQANANNDTATIPGADTNWEMMGGIWSPTKLSAVRKWAAGGSLVPTTKVPTTTAVPGSGQGFRIGRNYTTGAGGGLAIASIAFFDRALTNAEIAAQYAQMQAVVAPQGIAL